MSGQVPVFLSAFTDAEQQLAVTLRALLNPTTEVMESTHTNQTLRAGVRHQVELCFIAAGDLPFNSLHA
jgi:hypothetical protein